MFRKNFLITVFLVFVFNFIYTFELCGNILLFNKINEDQKTFKIKRDIFNMAKSSKRKEQLKVKEIEKKKIELDVKKSELRSDMTDSIQYEGSLKKGDKVLALINVNGEFFIVSKYDEVLKKIKILNITKKKLTVSVKSVKVDILKKGETDG